MTTAVNNINPMPPYNNLPSSCINENCICSAHTQCIHAHAHVQVPYYMDDVWVHRMAQSKFDKTHTRPSFAIEYKHCPSPSPPCHPRIQLFSQCSKAIARDVLLRIHNDDGPLWFTCAVCVRAFNQNEPKFHWRASITTTGQQPNSECHLCHSIFNTENRNEIILLLSILIRCISMSHSNRRRDHFAGRRNGSMPGTHTHTQRSEWTCFLPKTKFNSKKNKKPKYAKRDHKTFLTENWKEKLLPVQYYLSLSLSLHFC